MVPMEIFCDTTVLGDAISSLIFLYKSIRWMQSIASKVAPFCLSKIIMTK